MEKCEHDVFHSIFQLVLWSTLEMQGFGESSLPVPNAVAMSRPDRSYEHSDEDKLDFLKPRYEDPLSLCSTLLWREERTAAKNTPCSDEDMRNFPTVHRGEPLFLFSTLLPPRDRTVL